MTTLTFPEQDGIKSRISACLDALAIYSSSVIRREQIINNCLTPVALLIEAGELIDTLGQEENAVFAYCIKTLSAKMCRPRKSHHARGSLLPRP